MAMGRGRAHEWQTQKDRQKNVSVGMWVAYVTRVL